MRTSHQPYRKADCHNASGETMECNRGDRGKQVPEAPGRRASAEGVFRTGTVAGAYRGIEPDGEDTHQEAHTMNVASARLPICLPSALIAPPGLG
jgi:hypothetical protein